mgnify:CR=1 FL=1
MEDEIGIRQRLLEIGLTLPDADIAEVLEGFSLLEQHSRNFRELVAGEETLALRFES